MSTMVSKVSSCSATIATFWRWMTSLSRSAQRSEGCALSADFLVTDVLFVDIGFFGRSLLGALSRHGED
jgi:hypothetical protein